MESPASAGLFVVEASGEQLFGCCEAFRVVRRRCKGNNLASGRGRRCKGFAFAAWLRVLLQHAGVVHPCTTRTRTPCIDVLRRVQVMASVGHGYGYGYGNSISISAVTTTTATAAPVSLSNEARAWTWRKTW